MQRAATIDRWFANSLIAERMGAFISAIGAGLALLMSCLGVYALLAAAVTRRTREFGVRAAVGAGPRDVSRLIVGQAAVLVAAGLALGIPAAFGTARLLRSLLFGVTPFDGVAMAACAAALVLAATLAVVRPVRRARRLDPVAALRAE